MAGAARAMPLRGVSPWAVRRARALALGSGTGLVLPAYLLLPAVPVETLRWALDLAVHWQLLFVVGLCLGVSLWAWAAKRPAILALLLLAGLPWVWAPSQWRERPQHDAVERQSPLRVATANVHLDTLEVSALLTWARAQNADILVLHEVTPALAKTLREQTAYPHVFTAPSEDPFGVAVLSTVPARPEGLTSDSIAPRHMHEIIFSRASGAVRLVLLHPMPPIAAEFVRQRDELITRAAKSARRCGIPALLAGDLNGTVWSSALAGAFSDGWRSALPYAGTWPSAAPKWLGLGLDHILVDRQTLASNVGTGPAGLSDHRPVIATVELPLQADTHGCDKP